MKGWVGLGVVVVSLGGVLAWGWQHLHATDPLQQGAAALPAPSGSKNTPQPKVVLVDKPSHDFGTMEQEEDGKHLFEISNEGSGVLFLRFAEKTCGCTGLTIEDLVWTKDQKAPPGRKIDVPPGQKTILEFDWNTEFRTTLRTSAKLLTNDPAQPVVEFTVEGHVNPSVELSQRQIALADVRSSEGSALTVDVFSRMLENLEISKIESSNELVTAKWTPMSEDSMGMVSAKSGHRVAAMIAPGLPLGPFQVSLTIHTNCERRPTLTVDIMGKATGDVMLNPEELIFRSVRIAKGASMGLFIKVLGETSAEVKLARVVPEFLETQLVDVGNSRYHLKVQVPANAPGGPFRGVIELETNHPTAKVVKVPVRGDVIQ